VFFVYAISTIKDKMKFSGSYISYISCFHINYAYENKSTAYGHVISCFHKLS
jgi:hypothetical protein